MPTVNFSGVPPVLEYSMKRVCSVIDHIWRQNCGKNTNVANEPMAKCVTDVCTTFECFLW